LKRYDGAIEKYQKALEIDPCSINIYYDIVNLYLKQGKYSSAHKTARDADEMAKQKEKCLLSAEDLRLYGEMLHCVLREFDRAEQEYSAGLRLDPNHSGILIGLGNLFLDEEEKEHEHRIRNYWKGREQYRKEEGLLIAKTKDANDIEAHIQLGLLYLALGEHSEAEEKLKRALELDRDRPEIYNNLGIIRIDKEEFKESLSFFKDALSRDPDNLIVRNNLAGAYLRCSSLEQAEKGIPKSFENCAV